MKSHLDVILAEKIEQFNRSKDERLLHEIFTLKALERSGREGCIFLPSNKL